MISAYGHDDKACVFSSLAGLFDAKLSDQTQIVALLDREEIGSDGASGVKSKFMEIFISDLIKLSGRQSAGFEEVYKIFSKSEAISADVATSLDPDYKDVHDLRNVSRLGYGLAIKRYTGSGGKYSTSEASGEFVRKLRNVFSKNKNIGYQLTGGVGKVDKGGGGTVAKYLANRNMEVCDAGIPVLNMHAPLEIISKADLYAAYLGYRAFLE
jgi:aspartyl aminopeptidase